MPRRKSKLPKRLKKKPKPRAKKVSRVKRVVPGPRSPIAQQALALIGPHFASPESPINPVVHAGYRLWGKIVGTHLRRGHRSGIASKAEKFVSKHQPPRSEGLSVGYDRFLAKKTKKTWSVPFVRYTAEAFTIDYSIVNQEPHWRIRFTGRTRGRATLDQKLALLKFLKTTELPRPPGKRRLTFFFPCPPHHLEHTHPYVRHYLKALQPKLGENKTAALPPQAPSTSATLVESLL